MRRNNKKGFTIVELVIVIAVIAILAGVLIPTFAGIVSKANQSAAEQEAANAYKEDLAMLNAQVDKSYPEDSTVGDYDLKGVFTVNGNSYTYTYTTTKGYTATFTSSNNTWVVNKPSNSTPSTPADGGNG